VSFDAPDRPKVRPATTADRRSSSKRLYWTLGIIVPPRLNISSFTTRNDVDGYLRVGA